MISLWQSLLGFVVSILMAFVAYVKACVQAPVMAAPALVTIEGVLATRLKMQQQ